MAKARLTKEQPVARLLAQLPAMGHKELQQLWRKLFGREPSPGMRRNHMIPILAYRVQEKAFGGLKESTVRMLRELALGFQLKLKLRIDRRPAPAMFESITVNCMR